MCACCLGISAISCYDDTTRLYKTILNRDQALIFYYSVAVAVASYCVAVFVFSSLTTAETCFGGPVSLVLAAVETIFVEIWPIFDFKGFGNVDMVVGLVGQTTQ